MNNLQLIAVATRLFAIALVVYILKQVPVYLPAFADSDNASMQAYLIIITVGLVLIALLLWLFPLTLAKKIIPDTPQPDSAALDKDNFLTIGMILLGLFFLFYSIGDLIYWVLFVINDPEPMQLEQKIYLVITLTEFVIAFFLIFGSRGVANFILKLRGK